MFQIYDGYDDTAPSLIDLCTIGNNLTTATTSSNVVYIQTNLLRYTRSWSMNILWRKLLKSEIPTITEQIFDAKCGNQSTNIVLTNYTSYNLSSPGFPYGYDSYLNCSWIASTNISSMHPVFHFETLDLETQDDCLNDYVEIFSSSDSIEWTSLARRCKLSMLNPYFSGEKFLKLNFNTNYYQNRTGFHGKFQVDCGSTLTGSSGILVFDQGSFRNMGISSNMTCSWIVKVKPGKMIQFTFDKIKIDCASRSTIIIKNGVYEFSPILGGTRFCGNDTYIPQIPLTSGNSAIVKFELRSTSSPVFTLQYQEVGQDCSERIVISQNNKFAIISSPNYPNVPNPFTECTWMVSSASGENLKIEFLDRFDLKTNADCDMEYVELRRGTTRVSQVVGRYCDKKPNPQIIESSIIQVKYYTSVADPNNGFKMKISIAPCGAIYQYTEGTIMSPMHEQGIYPANIECLYHIIGSPGSFITITLQYIDLPVADNCSSTDHLAVYTFSQLTNDDSSSDGEFVLRGTYCGTVHNENGDKPTIVIPSDDAIIKFVAQENRYPGEGWKITFNTSREKCGGEFNGETGYVTSTGYPTAKQIPRYCEFKITVPEGRRIKIEFIDLDLFNSLYGRQRLAFVHGHERNFFIQMVTGNDTLGNLQPIYSSSNKMMISLRTLVPSQNRGFKLQFSSNSPTICDGDMNQISGTVESPKNESSFVCEYSRNGESFYPDEPNVGTIAIDFEQMTINNNCRFHGIAVKLYSDLNDNSNMFCINSLEYKFLRVPSSRVSLIVKKNSYVRMRQFNFKMNYKVHRCGGRVQLDYDQKIKFPFEKINQTNYGSIDCAWQVVAGENEVIIFNLTQAILKQTPDNEFIKVYQGGSQLHPNIASYTIDKMDTTFIISQRNQLFIEYHSNVYSTETSFEINLEASSVACGGILTDHSMHLKSPRNASSNHYPPNTECIWEINASPGYHIGLIFIKRFNIENSPNCQNDYVEIFDWNNDQWKSMKRVCGRDTPEIFNSTSSRMKVIFRSNDQIDLDGFTAVWYENCGGLFNATETVQTIASPNYPDNYKKSQHCVYNISVSSGKYINLRFVDFELEENMVHCIFDNVTIYKKQEYNANEKDLVGTYCGSNSPGNKRFLESTEIVFQSDRTIENRGFKFEYILDSCGGTVTKSQMIKSIKDLEINAHPHSSDCWWNITAPSGNKITVQFEELSLEYCSECYCDFLEVFSGEKAVPNKRIAKLCGNLTKSPPIIVIPENQGSVHLKTDSSRASQGFRAVILFSPECDHTFLLNESQSVIMINNLTTSDTSRLDCMYKIKSPPGTIIEFKFKQLHVALCDAAMNRTNNCSCNFVEIRDGIAPIDSVLGRFCGHTTPTQTLTSSNNLLWVHLIADGSSEVHGFQAEISMKSSICGKLYYNITLNPIELQSPMENNSYLPNLNCIWTIETQSDKIVEIIFEKFDIQDIDDSNMCTSDYLEFTEIPYYQTIYEGLGADFVHNGQSESQNSFYMGMRSPSTTSIYCGSKVPNTFLSSQPKINIKFKSDGSLEKSGFKMKLRSHTGKK